MPSPRGVYLVWVGVLSPGGVWSGVCGWGWSGGGCVVGGGVVQGGSGPGGVVWGVWC